MYKHYAPLRDVGKQRKCETCGHISYTSGFELYLTQKVIDDIYKINFERETIKKFVMAAIYAEINKRKAQGLAYEKQVRDQQIERYPRGNF